MGDPSAIADLAARVRRQPPVYLAPLAFNLSVSTSESDGLSALQVVADTIADALRRSPAERKTEDVYSALAKIALYGHVQVSLDDPRYKTALAKLNAEDDHRDHSDFVLTDLMGARWHLKDSHGKAILVTFWATWCPPCTAEVADLEELQNRFHDRGLEILAISSEDASSLQAFAAARNINYTILLDPDEKVKQQFLVNGIPRSFLYDREGHLTGETLDHPSVRGWLELLKHAGLN